MAQTEIFDRAAREFGRPFSFAEIESKLREPERGWTKDTGYVKSCIRDRIKRNKLRDLGDGSYEWIGDSNLTFSEMIRRGLDRYYKENDSQVQINKKQKGKKDYDEN